MAGEELVVKIIGDASNLKGTLEEAGSHVSGFSEKLGQIGKIATVGGAAITGAFTAIVLKTAEAGDQFDKMSLRTGVTVEDLSSLAYAANICGTDITTLENSLRFMARAMDDTSQGIGQSKDAFEKLGISVVDSEGNLRPTIEVMKEAATAIANLTNETDKVAVATDIFGSRYGTQLLPLLKEGGEGIEELMDRAKELGITMSTEAAAKAAEFNDRMTDLKGSLAGAGRTIGDTLIPAIIPLIEKVTEIVGKVANWAEENPKLVETITKVAAVIGGLAVVGGPILMAVAAFTKISGAISALGTVSTGPIGILILAIGGVYLAWKNWDNIVTYVSSFVDKIKGYLDNMKTIAIQKVTDMIDWIIKKFEDLANLPGKMLEWGKNAITGFTDGIKAKMNIVTDAVTGVANKIKNFFGFESPPKEGPLSESDKWMPNMMAMLADGITRNVPKVSKAAEDLAKKISINFDNMAKGAVTTTNKMMDDMGKAIEDKEITVIEPTKTFASNFMDIFTQLKNDFNSNFIKPVMGYLENQLASAIYGLLTQGAEFEWRWKTFWEGLKNTLISAVSQMIAKLIVLASFSWLFNLLGLPVSLLGLNKGGGIGYQLGGKVKGYQFGGLSDTVPAMLTPGEYVIAKPMVDFIRKFRAVPQNLVEAISKGIPTPTPAFAGGGIVGNTNIAASGFGETKIYLDIHDNRISDDVDIKRLADVVSNEIVRKINLNRRY